MFDPEREGKKLLLVALLAATLSTLVIMQIPLAGNLCVERCIKGLSLPEVIIFALLFSIFAYLSALAVREGRVVEPAFAMTFLLVIFFSLCFVG